MRLKCSLNMSEIGWSQRIAKRLVRSLIGSSISLCLMLGSSLAHAWGSQGHQVIAGLALAQLTPKAKAEVDRLLAQEPGETLVTISTWADEHKTHPLRAGTTSTSHATVARLSRSAIVQIGNASWLQ